MLELNDKEIEKTIIESKVPVVLDFYADWCQPCKAIKPIIEQASIEFGDKAVIAKVNVDDSPASATRYKIRNIPTILFFKNGQLVDKHVGAITSFDLKTKINSFL